MNTKQLLRICKDLGINLLVDDISIREQTGYYENYNQLEANNNEWYYSEMNFENRPSPERDKIKKFHNKEDAIKYFYLKTLRKFYFKKIHFPNNPIRNLKTREETKMFFDSLGIREECYSFTKMRPQSIFAEVSESKMVVSYIDQQNNRKFSTLPLNLERGIFAMYKLAYALHLLKVVEKTYLENGVLENKFDDNDIEIFIK
ncbi:hypothetical protein N5C46_10555 [Rossellomorea vietnamensis]|uniref:Uncharacterized protein n=1 Tax=Rossellomorea vietnamensis TaxID=218284 RepID=A0ACD4CDH1_9BACI|nr:hypothetical protein [Rossellomorea vietnamensis]UXH46456.1 hypothetical protein N5C46_10555 [Rossellomorea vietnamensis]